MLDASRCKRSARRQPTTAWFDTRASIRPSERSRGRETIRGRRSFFIAATAVAIVVASIGAGRASAASLPQPLPSAMASVGDSITRAYNTGPSAYVDYPANSWSTGTSTTVNSHYTRLLAKGAAITGKNYNDAVSGAKMADLNGQMAVVNTQGVGYVTVLVGGNDVCTSSESTMTSVAAFAAQFRTAMTTLSTGSASALVYVVSIPDVYNLWSVLKGNGSARFVWAIFGICQSMLARPLSTASADVERRAHVRQRNIDFNTQLKTICESQEFAATCRYDQNAAFNTKFTTADVSTRDYFHPSVAGQAKLAAASWTAGYWGP